MKACLLMRQDFYVLFPAFVSVGYVDYPLSFAVCFHR